MDHRFVRLVVYVVRFAGVVAGLWGVAYVINGATQAGGFITVRAVPRLDAAEQLGLSGVKLPSGVSLAGEELSLQVWNSTLVEQVVSRADIMLGGLCALVAAFLLRGLLTSMLERQPYRSGNAARVAWLAVLAVAAGAAQALPGLAGAAVLDRVGLSGTFGAAYGLSWVPFVGAAFLLALAVALRQGRAASPAPAAGSGGA
ncbi:hypothetical protein [Nonomuraea pusilla]|uniref:Uncharacterized protein n=1 Tax=Nonomuraea pusilla TaxID=46177 RepID=A0A1H8GC99_9ACTN|nr:hypothetical protein [Nonomuraea pusilla]SEN41613.1 hypothetical protein SAMN05660976_07512 [Nonomuraea pusilla]